MPELGEEFRYYVVIPYDVYKTLEIHNQLIVFGETKKYVYGVATRLFPQDLCIVYVDSMKIFMNRAMELDDMFVVIFSATEFRPATAWGYPVYSTHDGKVYEDDATVIYVTELVGYGVYAIGVMRRDIIHSYSELEDDIEPLEFD